MHKMKRNCVVLWPTTHMVEAIDNGSNTHSNSTQNANDARAYWVAKSCHILI